MTDEYTKRLERLYAAIVAYKSAHDGCSPSLRQLIDATDHTSTFVVRRSIETLELQGRVKVIRNKQGQMCGIKIVGARWVAPEGEIKQ